jgi:hypothetical protein
MGYKARTQSRRGGQQDMATNFNKSLESVKSNDTRSIFNKTDRTDSAVFVYMLEKFLEKEFEEKLKISNSKFEQEFLESVQNVVLCINLKLIKSTDIVVEYGEIKKVNKIIIKDGVFVYDAEKYPIFSKKFEKKTITDVEKNKLKLKRILAA